MLCAAQLLAHIVDVYATPLMYKPFKAPVYPDEGTGQLVLRKKRKKKKKTLYFYDCKCFNFQKMLR